MALFAKGLSQDELDDAAKRTSVVLKGLASIFLDAIIQNVTRYITTNIHDRIAAFKDSAAQMMKDDSLGIHGLTKKSKGLIALKAYGMWGVGAFLQGQHLLSSNDTKRFTDSVAVLICSQKQTEYFQSYFDFIRGNESDKIMQASMLLNDMLTMLDLVDLSIYSDDKVKAVSYHVPILELFLGYLALHLDSLFRPANVASQIRMIEEYEKPSRETYRIDFEGAHRLLGISKWT